MWCPYVRRVTHLLVHDRQLLIQQMPLSQCLSRSYALSADKASRICLQIFLKGMLTLQPWLITQSEGIRPPASSTIHGIGPLYRWYCVHWIKRERLSSNHLELACNTYVHRGMGNKSNQKFKHFLPQRNVEEFSGVGVQRCSF